MNRREQIPTSRFRPEEADRLIANYGVKKPDDDRQRVKDSLRGLKRDFMAMQREQERDRGRGR